MKFIIKKNDFINILQKTQGIVEKRNTMPVLANALIEAKGSTISVVATDLEIFIKDSTEAQVNEEGSITINARKLFEIVKEAPTDEINISVEGAEKLTLKSGKSKFNILGITAKDFPAFPKTEEENLKVIDSDILSEVIEKTGFSVSTDETRYNINGYLFENLGGTLKVVTTDGHRLALIGKKIKDLDIKEGGAILPRKGVNEIKKILDEKKGIYKFTVTDKNAILKHENTIINIRLIEGEFPDYKKVEPKDNDKIVTSDKEELLSCLKRVSLVSIDKVKGVKFNFEKNNLILTSSNPDMGDAREEVKIDYDLEKMEIAFNAKYFVDALEAIDTDKVEIKLKDQLSPCILRPQGEEDITYVIMPMIL